MEIKPDYFVDEKVLFKVNAVEQQGWKVILITEKNWKESISKIANDHSILKCNS